MDYNKYINDGWGLSKFLLEEIERIITKMDKDTIRIVEFGSGTSTRFLHDLNEEVDKTLEITSFDNDKHYAYKAEPNDSVKLLMRDLVECSNESYNRMFENKQYDSKLMKPKTSALSTRQQNNFYDIQKGDLTGEYDIMILDGPNGNGRNLAFLHMKNHLKSGSLIIIDDIEYYDFAGTCQSIIDCNQQMILKLGKNKDNFIILEVE